MSTLLIVLSGVDVGHKYLNFTCFENIQLYCSAKKPYLPANKIYSNFGEHIQEIKNNPHVPILVLLTKGYFEASFLPVLKNCVKIRINSKTCIFRHVKGSAPHKRCVFSVALVTCSDLHTLKSLSLSHILLTLVILSLPNVYYNTNVVRYKTHYSMEMHHIHFTLCNHTNELMQSYDCQSDWPKKSFIFLSH